MIIYDLPIEDYFSLPGISQSSLKALLKSPAHFNHYQTHREEHNETVAQRIGKELHTCILEPERFLREYERGPQAGRNTKIWKDWEVDTQKTLIKSDEYDSYQRIRDAVYTHHSARQLLECEKDVEVTATWTNYKDLECKARADAVLKEHPIILDLKSCRDASKRGAIQSIRKYKYYWQAVWYLDGFYEMGKEQFIFIFFEKESPHGVGVYDLAEDIIEQGRQELSNVMDLYIECTAGKEWPAYSNYLETIETLE